eukprot:scaffold196126_cov54-Attheya_sp.AAC.2
MEFCTSSSGEKTSVVTAAQHPDPLHNNMACVTSKRMSSFDTIQASNISSHSQRYQRTRPRPSSTSTSSRTPLNENENPNRNKNVLLTGLMDMFSKLDCSTTTSDDHLFLQHDKAPTSPSSSSSASVDPYCGAMSPLQEDKENAKPTSNILTACSTNRTGRSSSIDKHPTPSNSSGRNTRTHSRRRAPLQPTGNNYVSPSSRRSSTPPQVSSKRFSLSSSSSSKPTSSSTLEQKKKQEDDAVVVRMIQTRLSTTASDVTSQSMEVCHMMQDLLTTDHPHEQHATTTARTTTKLLGRSNSTSRRIKSPVVVATPQPQYQQQQQQLPIKPRLSLRWKKMGDASSNRRKSPSPTAHDSHKFFAS